MPLMYPGNELCSVGVPGVTIARTAQVQMEHLNALVDALTLHAADKPGTGPLDPKAGHNPSSCRAVSRASCARGSRVSWCAHAVSGMGMYALCWYLGDVAHTNARLTPPVLALALMCTSFNDGRQPRGGELACTVFPSMFGMQMAHKAM